MLFHSIQFLLFLPLVFALYWGVARSERAQKWLLFCASMVFYMAWNPAPVVLILYLSTTDWYLARWMQKTEAESRRKLLVRFSIFNNLAVLGVFKYTDWITKSVVDTAAHFGVTLVYKPLGLVLPVGLSFVVFQCLSYTVDVYRRDLEARKSWLEVVLFISFFPQIVAGPIVRAADFLPQLQRKRELSEADGARALFRIATGMFKKLVIADLLSANLVDRVFAEPGNYSGLEVTAAVFAYTAQIYYDFSAYSDIAIGAAGLFGFTLKENFDKPYLSTNLFEFWRRWHMSLGSWLRDYLYIPLGGNKGSKPRTLWNLWVTMILGGIWHGADWRFVIWGAVHAVVLMCNRMLWWTFGRPRKDRPLAAKIFTGILTFIIVMEARIVFRAPDWQSSWDVFMHQFQGGFASPNLTALVLTVMAAATLGHFMTHLMYERLVQFFIAAPVPVRALAMLGLCLGIKEVSSFEVQPFIYFQF